MNRLHSFLAATITGGVVLVSQVASAQLPNVAGQAGQAAQGAANQAGQAAQGAAGQAKGAAGQAKGEVRREGNQARRETRQQGREAARETREGTREAARDTRDAARGARDTAREATDGARDTAREAAKGARNARDSAKDTARDTRDAAKDTARNAREGAKDVARDAKRESRKFNAENVKVDDLGLSVKTSDDRGLLISDIQRSGPLARVGFQRNDRIVSVNGERIVRQGDFVRYLFAEDIRDERVKVIVLRDGVEEVVYVEPAVIIREYETVVVSDRDPIRDFGIVLDDQSSDRLLVAKVIADSPADKAGVRRDDVIVAVNDREMQSPDDLAMMIEKYEDESLDLQVRRERQAKVIKVERVEFVR